MTEMCGSSFCPEIFFQKNMQLQCCLKEPQLGWRKGSPASIAHHAPCMFPRTPKVQKTVDMFLANLKTVDMFLEAKVRTGRIVDIEKEKKSEFISVLFSFFNICCIDY